MTETAGAGKRALAARTSSPSMISKISEGSPSLVGEAILVLTIGEERKDVLPRDEGGTVEGDLVQNGIGGTIRILL